MTKRTPLAFDSSAPEEWLTEASSPARLYRRLLRAIASGDDAVDQVWQDGTAAEQLSGALDDLRSQAVAITEHLVVVAHLPFAKRQNALRPLRSQVDDVEILAARIRRSAVHARGHKEINGGLEEVKDRLDALDKAREEAFGDLPDEDRRRLRRAVETFRKRARARQERRS